MKDSRQRYGNRSHHSGVTHFDLSTPSAIHVWFTSGDGYLYTSEVTGAEEIEEMRARATAGCGLSTYISQQVRERYAAKLA